MTRSTLKLSRAPEILLSFTFSRFKGNARISTHQKQFTLNPPLYIPPLPSLPLPRPPI